MCRRTSFYGKLFLLYYLLREQSDGESLRAGQFRVRAPVEVRFSSPVQTVRPLQSVLDLIRGGKIKRQVCGANNSPHLVLALRMGWNYKCPPPLCAFVARYKENFNFSILFTLFILYYCSIYRGADKSLARSGRKQATETEDFDVHISYLLS